MYKWTNKQIVNDSILQYKGQIGLHGHHLLVSLWAPSLPKLPEPHEEGGS